MARKKEAKKKVRKRPAKTAREKVRKKTPKKAPKNAQEKVRKNPASARARKAARPLAPVTPGALSRPTGSPAHAGARREPPPPVTDAPGPRAPLADRMRPRALDEFVGQGHMLGEGALLRRAIEGDKLTSSILWGPPGSGKTSLAKVIANVTGAYYVAFSAVLSGVAEVRRIVAEARERLDTEKRPTILFVDEIHRFNKAQQDAFLPHVEAGTITLIGATTENPSFELTGPLLSRCRVFKLEMLRPEDVRAIVGRALADEGRGLAALKPEVDDEALDFIVNFSNGDARTALNALELAVTAGRLGAAGERRVTREIAEEAMQRKSILYDKSGEEHYNIISALHKSLRGSDVQAALYWLARMIEGGEDPLYVARRLVRFAAEDVGLADPQALPLAMAAKEAVESVGLPEGDLFLAEAVAYLAAAPKSNSLYAAMNEVRRDIREKEAPPVPLHIRNAPTRLMKELGYGKGYQYDHDEPGHVSAQSYLPEALEGRTYYRPGEYGFEKDMRRRLAYWERMRRRAASGSDVRDARPGRARVEDVPPKPGEGSRDGAPEAPAEGPTERPSAEQAGGAEPPVA